VGRPYNQEKIAPPMFVAWLPEKTVRRSVSAPPPVPSM
jgi:hypothetical protein